jgi:hypothetical protein
MPSKNRNRNRRANLKKAKAAKQPTMKSYTLDVPATNMDLMELIIKILKECPTDPRDTRIKLAFGNCSLLCRDAEERAEHHDSVTVWEAHKTLVASYHEEEEEPEETPQQEEPDKEYINKLLAQENHTICPSCYEAGERKPLCRNMVLHRKEDGKPALVCCWLGDKHEISPEAFQVKLEAFKKL